MCSQSVNKTSVPIMGNMFCAPQEEGSQDAGNGFQGCGGHWNLAAKGLPSRGVERLILQKS